MRIARTLRVTGVAVASAAAVAAMTPVAGAQGGGGSGITSFGFSVKPSSVRAGGLVRLNASGCQVPSVTASSGVFDTVTLNEGHPATVKVDTDAKPGAQYTVTFDCNGEKGTTTLTISTTPSVTPGPPVTHRHHHSGMVHR